MNREEIILMYEKANGWSPEGFDNTVKELERFAALVAAAEREACAKTVENHRVGWADEDMELNDIAAEIRARGLTSLQRQLIDAGALASDPAGLKTMNREAEQNGEEL
jgi:hypothetical protein